MSNLFDSAERLSEFIESRGMVLPEGALSHACGGPEGYSCFICEHYSFNPTREYTLNNTYVYDLALNDTTLYNTCSSYFIALNCCPDCLSLLGDEGLIVNLGYEHQKKIIEITRRLTYNASTGGFDEESDLFTQGRIRCTDCVLCHSSVLADPKRYDIAWRPVGMSKLIEGPVMICEPCTIVKELFLEESSIYYGYYDQDEETSLEQCQLAKCPKCNSMYSITAEEAMDRTEGVEHLCNSCLSNEYGLMDENRFKAIMCLKCNEVSLLDLSLPYHADKHKQIEFNFTCQNCHSRTIQTADKKQKELFNSKNKDMESNHIFFVGEGNHVRIVIGEKFCTHHKRKIYHTLLTDELSDPNADQNNYVIDKYSTAQNCTGNPSTCNCSDNLQKLASRSTVGALLYIENKLKKEKNETHE